jgi:hypothetical protein
MLRMIGLTDTVSKCDCCGKQNLKKVVVLTKSEDLNPGSDEVGFYGSQCAAKKLRSAGAKGFKNDLTVAQINKLAIQANHTTKNNLQNDLLAKGLVDYNKGWFCLPGQNDLTVSVRYNNLIEVYPCFA